MLGGVARNVAECMSKLGTRPFMISAVGVDMAGILSLFIIFLLSLSLNILDDLWLSQKQNKTRLILTSCLVQFLFSSNHNFFFIIKLFFFVELDHHFHVSISSSHALNYLHRSVINTWFDSDIEIIIDYIYIYIYTEDILVVN